MTQIRPNKESDDVICGSNETAQHSIKNISKNIRAVVFKLGTKNVRKKIFQKGKCHSSLH